MKTKKREDAQHAILGALEDGLELMAQNPCGKPDSELAENIDGYVQLANGVCKKFGFDPYFVVPKEFSPAV